MYDEDEGYFPKTNYHEPTSSVLALPSTYSINSLQSSTMTNTNSTTIEELQEGKQTQISEEKKSNSNHVVEPINKSDSNRSSSSGYGSSKQTVGTISGELYLLYGNKIEIDG